MSEWNPQANDIFLNAIGVPTEQCAEYVTEACGADSTLRREVEELLVAHQQVGNLLEEPPVDLKRTTPFSRVAEQVGAVVGHYRLGEKIGEGGMGVVFEAEQQEPVRRKVALKIVRPGMDTNDVIARFEAERQALALMDHPNIARVLDAGSTEAGHPYFVMELVRGIPITNYCFEQGLNTFERLELFVQVCHAVQHAHQKGIIHRDIKPSNVLVTVKDGVPVPKVIDFGVAKALNQDLTERKLRTCFAQIIGTPLYMSPEQATLGGLDVDTRGDIYSLGVLLYELLTGTTPFERDVLEHATYAEFRRIMSEEDPPKPSIRLSALSTTNSKAQHGRPIENGKFGQALRGELDWIVMRALEKDRGLRYQTARGFGEDVTRFLRDEPVQACPPSATYRVKKFVRRHRTLISAAALVVAVMIVGTVVSVWQAVRATRAERLAQRRLLAVEYAQEQTGRAMESSRRNKAYALSSNAGFFAASKRYDMANAQFRKAVELDPYNSLATNNFAWFLVTCPDWQFWDAPLALELATRAVSMVPESGLFWNTLGVAHYRAGNWSEAIYTLERSDAMLGEDGCGFNGFFLAMSHWQLGNGEMARFYYQTAEHWMTTAPSSDNPELHRFAEEAVRTLEIGLVGE